MLHGQSGSVGWLEWSGIALLRDQKETWRAVEWLRFRCEWKASWFPNGEGGRIQVQRPGRRRIAESSFRYNTRFLSLYSAFPYKESYGNLGLMIF